MKRLTKVSLIVTLFSIIDNIYALNNDDLINKSTNINIEKYPDADAVLIQDDTTVIYQLDGTSKPIQVQQSKSSQKKEKG